jgi:hypothetical protein
MAPEVRGKHPVPLSQGRNLIVPDRVISSEAVEEHDGVPGPFFPNIERDGWRDGFRHAGADRRTLFNSEPTAEIRIALRGRTVKYGDSARFLP